MADALTLRTHELPQTSSGPSALFYPHIHFRSRRWLRMALLYYENISRIVPDGVDAETPAAYTYNRVDTRGLLEDVRELRSLRFIRDESPTSALPSVTDDFFDFYSANLSDPVKRAALIPAVSKRAFYTIHPDKIDPALLDVLQQAQDAHRKVGDLYSDWRIEPVVAAFYMLFLARQMAGRRPLVSDSSVYQSLLFQEANRDDHSSNNADRRFRLATTVIDSVIPADLDNVSLDKLLRVRTECVSDRQRFQDKMAEFGKELSGAQSEEELSELLDRLGRRMRDEISITTDKMRSLNVTTTTALFGLSIPSWATAAWGLALSAPIIIAGLGAIALSGALLKHRFEKKITALNPFNYLLTTSELVTAQSWARDIVSLNLDSNDDDEDQRELAPCL